MLVTTLIERKRDGGSLTPEEWAELVRDYTAGSVPDYQMAALLMAVFLNGMTTTELAALTDAMIASGSRLDFGEFAVPRIDKHSTGGVGDKVSLVLAPLVASCDVAVPMMSGRGLGHTGGTLDKLEAIPGFQTGLSLKQARQLVERIGVAMMGQTPEIAPADRKLYALRDATATVEVIPLIAASIMSKKLAEGLNGLVLDIKRGSGAFLPDLVQGLELARTMISLGEERGCPTVALVTAMDRPLGRACGNAVETVEAIRALRGEGPADLMEVTYALGVEMLLLASVERDRTKARARLEQAIAAGRAVEKFRQLVAAQGGDSQVVDDPGLLPTAPVQRVYEAPMAGHVARVAPRIIGKAIVTMGGGRRTMDDEIDHRVGFVVQAKPGDAVDRGMPLARVLAGDEATLQVGMEALAAAVDIAPEPPPTPLRLVSHRVTHDGVVELA